MKKDLNLLVRTIKAKRKMSREAIAASIGVVRETLSRAVAANDEGVYDLLEKIHGKYLGDDIINKESPTVMALSASVTMLYKEVAILKGKNEKIKPEDAYEKMKEQARLILEGL